MCCKLIIVARAVAGKSGPIITVCGLTLPQSRKLFPFVLVSSYCYLFAIVNILVGNILYNTDLYIRTAVLK